MGGVSIPLCWGLIWISDTSSSRLYGLEQPLEAGFLWNSLKEEHGCGRHHPVM